MKLLLSQSRLKSRSKFAKSVWRHCVAKIAKWFSKRINKQQGGFQDRTLLNQIVFESTKLSQYNRLCDRYSLDLVRRVCNDKDVSQIWKFSRSTPTAAKTCKIIMCMFSELARDYKQLCGLCGYLCSNKVNHRLCFCNKLKAKREINLLITKYGYRYVIAYSKNAPLIQCEYCAVPVYIKRNCWNLMYVMC